MTNTPEPRLWSITEAARYLGCSRGHIYGLIAHGALSAIELKATGTRPFTRVSIQEVKDLIDSRTRRTG